MKKTALIFLSLAAISAIIAFWLAQKTNRIYAAPAVFNAQQLSISFSSAYDQQSAELLLLADKDKLSADSYCLGIVFPQKEQCKLAIDWQLSAGGKAVANGNTLDIKNNGVEGNRKNGVIVANFPLLSNKNYQLILSFHQDVTALASANPIIEIYPDPANSEGEQALSAILSLLGTGFLFIGVLVLLIRLIRSKSRS